MPIFQASLALDLDLDLEPDFGMRPASPSPPFGPSRLDLRRRLSEESIRTELCEGPVPAPEDGEGEEGGEAEGNVTEPTSELDAHVGARPIEGGAMSAATSDRAELIERLKRGESPTWVPNRHLELEPLHHACPPPPTSPPPSARTSRTSRRPRLPSPDFSPPGRPLLAAATASSDLDPDEADRRLLEGPQTRRPSSALHTGDFTPEDDHDNGSACPRQIGPGPADGHVADGHMQAAPMARAWGGPATPPSAAYPVGLGGATAMMRVGMEALRSGSPQSSWLYKVAPTSPLARSVLNEDLSPPHPALPAPIDIASPGGRSPTMRRYTANSIGPAGLDRNSSGCRGGGQPPPPNRSGSSTPYRAHQPCRSTASVGFSVGTSPFPPGSGSRRRPSHGSDSVMPIQRASMVGSYEESILRGRMSTMPSRPLEFLAQIGVLGMGKYPPGLRCPPHVTLPFHAFFYRYPSSTSSMAMYVGGGGGGRVLSDDEGPSPYVGHIDLEGGLPNPDEGQRLRRKMRSRCSAGERRAAAADAAADAGTDAAAAGEAGTAAADNDQQQQQLPPPPPPLSRPMRRPDSVKAPPGGSYRIPEKGQIQIIIKNQNKTAVKLFLIPYDLTGMEPGTKTFIRQRSFSVGPMVEHGLPAPPPGAAAPAERPILRYLVHLHMCSPSRGRYYLYKAIRVVFANRVPDGQERLRNETTSPDPQFTPYKPARAGGSRLRQRCQHPDGHSHHWRGSGGSDTPANADPDADADADATMDRSPLLSSIPVETTPAETYDKLKPAEFGRRPQGVNDSHGPSAEGLLSRQLRSLGVCPSQQQGYQK